MTQATTKGTRAGWPAKTSVSPRSSPMGTFRADEDEERGETDVFAG